MKKPILTQQKIEEQLFGQGERADFSNQSVPSFAIINEKISKEISFENAEIEGQMFMADIFINGDLSFKNCFINGSLYLANLHLNGSLILENARIKGAVNLVGAEIEKDVAAKNLKSQGFVSLAKAKIKGDVILEETKIQNVFYENFSVNGDLILEEIKVGGSINLKGADIDNLLDLDEMILENNLVLQKANFKIIEAENIIIKGKTIN